MFVIIIFIVFMKFNLVNYVICFYFMVSLEIFICYKINDLKVNKV